MGALSVWPLVFSSSLTKVDLIAFFSKWTLWQEGYVPFLGEDSKVWDEPQLILRRSPFMLVSTMMSPKNPLAPRRRKVILVGLPSMIAYIVHGCSLCLGDGENVNHLLPSCAFARGVWLVVLSQLGVF